MQILLQKKTIETPPSQWSQKNDMKESLHCNFDALSYDT